MKLFRKTKLNQKGFSLHFVLPVIVIALVAFLGYRLLFASHADSTTAILSTPVIGITSAGTDNGYWLYSSDGGVYAEGSAPFFGSMGGKNLSAPIVGMSPTYDHKGYYLVGSDGAVYSFGDAQYAGGFNCYPVKPGNVCGGKITYAGSGAIGIAAHNGGGYWIMTNVGATYALGGAPYLGNANGSSGIVNLQTSPDGAGYIALSYTGQGYNFDKDTSCNYYATDSVSETVDNYLGNNSCVYLDASGDIYVATNNFGGVIGWPNKGIVSSTINRSPFVGIASTGDKEGYWAVQANGNVYAFGDAVLNYTTPLKYTRTGNWSLIGHATININSAETQSVSYLTYACKLQVGNRTYVDGLSAVTSSIAAALLTNSNSLLAETFVRTPSTTLIGVSQSETAQTVGNIVGPFVQVQSSTQQPSVQLGGQFGGQTNTTPTSLSNLTTCGQV